MTEREIFWEAYRAGVEKIVLASSGCVYPNYLQSNSEEELYLKEELVNPPHDADNMQGWAKLMGELTLGIIFREFGLKFLAGTSRSTVLVTTLIPGRNYSRRRNS